MLAAFGLHGALGAALSLGACMWLAGRHGSQPGFARLTANNYRGSRIPAVGGIAIMLAVLVTEAVVATAALAGIGGSEQADLGFAGSRRAGSAPLALLASPEHRGTLVLALGFFLLGLVDDIAGDSGSKGMWGHLRELMRGRITTGSIKALGGGLLALIVGAWWERSVPLALLDGVLIALASNLLNLLDLRPGRAGKVFVTAWIPLALAGRNLPYLPASAAFAAAASAWLPYDLREKAMLGDSGSTMLGAVLGAGAISVLGVTGRALAVAVLVAANLASERWSFSRIIEARPFLRWLDDLGRRGNPGGSGCP